MPVFAWNGFYAGVYAGAAWGRSSASSLLDCSPTASPPAYICMATGTGAADAALVNAAGTGTISASGFTGGAQAGYNVQSNNLVYGVEADFGAFNLSGSQRRSAAFVAAALGATGTFTLGTSFNTDWLATLRGRFGWLFRPDVLAYLTGGLALTELEVGWSYSDTAFGTGAGSATASSLKTGWTLGGGVEWALGQNWSVKGEYLYVDFGKVTATGTIFNFSVAPPYAQGLSTSADLTAHVARVGVNRRF
jgi:outer membrane immunogenic protein